MNKFEFAVQLISAILGAIVFSIGIGSLTIGSLLSLGFSGLHALAAFTIISICSLLTCPFTRPFFMRFAIPFVALFSDELSSDNFTLRQLGTSLVLFFSLLTSVVFAFIPTLKVAGAVGAICFATYIIWAGSEFPTEDQ